MDIAKLGQRWLLRRISRGDDCLISLVSQALIHRFGVLHPEYDLVVMALPKHNPREREAILEYLGNGL